MTTIAEVRLLQARREFDRGYSYVVTEDVTAKVGSIAAVPFGKANRPAFGIVTKLRDKSPDEDVCTYKNLLYVLEEPYCLPEKTVELCEYFSTHLLCPSGELMKAALPTGLTFHIRELIALHPEAPTDYESGDTAVNSLLLLLKKGAQVEICDRNRSACEQLFRSRVARRVYLPESAANRKFIRVVKALCSPDNLPEGAFSRMPLAKAAVYKEMLKYLCTVPTDSVSEREICDRFSISKPSLSLLEKRGLIQIDAKEVYRAVYEDETESAAPALPDLNPEQENALTVCSALLKKKKGAAALLYGVTGSGKTRVMMHLVSEALKQNKGVIFLVPEIGLTSNVAKTLLAHFPNEVCVLHSGLSAGERHDAWVALKKGQKHIVLGTRSAIFAPIEDLGLILMDEEQDQSYNADNAPRYHARDIARWRAAHENALLLLASATPDIETYHKAKTGVYTLCKLSERALGNELPSVQIVDLKPDIKEAPDALIGAVLREAIGQTLERGEQCLLFMNRRGYQYAPFCPSCGHVITCPNCSVALTLHSHRGRYACCHYCGYSTPPPATCPSCGAEHIFFKGYGTQRLEEEVRTLFPKARVLRMDADTVSQKLSHEKITEKFREHKADILLGTQMVAKGHDFKDVTLVGVVMADTSLYLGDYRASEETFALLTQVIGRAGRDEKPGRAIIQTLNPDHEIFPLSATQNYEAFFDGEIALRKALLYPPFCHLSSFTISGEREDVLNRAVLEFNEHIAEELEERRRVKIIVYGPIEPAVLRVNNLYRKKFVIKHQNDRATREFFACLMTWFQQNQPSGLNLFYDATPNQI